MKPGSIVIDSRTSRIYKIIEFYSNEPTFLLNWLPETKYKEDVEWVEKNGSNISFKIEELKFFSLAKEEIKEEPKLSKPKKIPYYYNIDNFSTSTFSTSSAATAIQYLSNQFRTPAGRTR